VSGNSFSFTVNLWNEAKGAHETTGVGTLKLHPDENMAKKQLVALRDAMEKAALEIVGVRPSPMPAELRPLKKESVNCQSPD
jgi:hypothetical protein